MNPKFDLVVIGAGPAGLIASKTAAEKGLNVALIDVKKDICSALLASNTSSTSSRNK